VDPIDLAGVGVEAVEPPGHVGGVHQAVGDGHGGHAAIEPVVAPDLARPGDVARSGRVDAVKQPFAPSVGGVLPDGHVHAAGVKHRRGDDLARADVTAVVLVRAVPFALVPFVVGNRLAVAQPVLRRVTVVGPHFREARGLLRHLGQRLERVADAVAAAEEYERLAVHLGERRRRPLAVEKPRADPLVLPGHQPAGPLVERDQRGRLGGEDLLVGLVDPVRRAHVEHVAVNEHRAARRVVHEYAQLFDRVESPEDIAVAVRKLDGLFAVAGHVLAFVGVRAVVAVGLAVDVEAKHVAGARDNIHAVAVHRGRRADAQVLVPEVHLFGDIGPLRADQLPYELAGGFVEALDQPTAGAGEPRVFGHGQVVGAHEHLAAGHGRVAVGGGAEPDGPLDVLGRGRVDPAAAGHLLARLERVGQPRLLGNHVPRVASTPLRPIRSRRTPGRH